MTEMPVKGRRRYDNTGRAEQARATRQRVLQATLTVLLDRGYTATTMGRVAAEAGVSVETVYKGFTSKPELVRALLGMVLLGDDEPVALADRREFRAIGDEQSGPAVLSRYAALVRQLYDRLGALPAILLVGARAGATELRTFAAEVNAKRLIDSTTTAQQVAARGPLREGVDLERARDLIWTLNSPEVHHLLTVDRGWTADDYQQWLSTALTDALLETRPGSGPFGQEARPLICCGAGDEPTGGCCSTVAAR